MAAAAVRGKHVVSSLRTPRVQVPNNHIYFPKINTIIPIPQIPSTNLLGAWTLRVNYYQVYIPCKEIEYQASQIDFNIVLVVL